MTGLDAADVGAAVEVVRQRIDDAGGDESVSILPVTKGFGPDVIVAARAAGCRSIGENYAQELVAKRDVLDRQGGSLEVHFIGQLQTNKVRQLTDLVDVYGRSIGCGWPARSPNAPRRPRVLIQVDTTGEPGKGGCPLAELDALVERVGELELDLEGLMTVGPTTGGPETARTVDFARFVQAVDRLGLTVCSMGMTADLELAVQEGTTQIRVGTALFGVPARPVPVWRDQER